MEAHQANDGACRSGTIPEPTSKPGPHPATSADSASTHGSLGDMETAAALTVGHRLLHQSRSITPGHDDDDSGERRNENLALSDWDDHETGAGVPRSIAIRLYVSHFLSTWNSRLFEFGAALFLTAVFPGTLLPVSIYSLVRNAGYIVCSQPLGAWINKGNRLNVVRTSIVGQRVPVAVSCALLLVLEIKGSTWGFRRDDGIFAVIVLLAVVEKLCSTMNTISVERDWVGHNAPAFLSATSMYLLPCRSLSSRKGTKLPVVVS